MPDYLLRLFVTGRTATTQAAVDELRLLCEREFPQQYQIEVVDVREHPELAEDERILATPTVVRRLPPPVRRVIGNLSDAEQVLRGLDLLPLRPDIDDAAAPPPSTDGRSDSGSWAPGR